MRIPQTKLHRAKAIIHAAQALLIVVAGCLTLAVMTNSGPFGGETGFYFALCFVTIPAIVFQVMVPLWSRAWRFNNLYAFAVIDVLFAVLWFAAAVAVAAWNAHGIAKGKSGDDGQSQTTGRVLTRANDATTTDGTCNSFGYGSPLKCSVSKATVGFGFTISLLFALTAAIAIHAIREYRMTGVVPMSDVGRKQNGAVDNEDGGGKDVWSTNTDELNTRHSDDRLAYGQHSDSDHEELLGSERRRPTSGGYGRGDLGHQDRTAPHL